MDGFDVAVNDISSNASNLKTLEVEIAGKGRRTLSLIADVSREDEVRDLVARVVAELGGLDVVRCLRFHGFASAKTDCGARWSPMRVSASRGVF